MPSKTNSATVQKMPAKLRLKLANECEDMLSRARIKTMKKEYRYYFVHSRHVDEKNFVKMMALFEPLMKDMYQKSSWGWDINEKMSEWKHPRTKVVFVTKKDAGDLLDDIISNKLPPDEDQLVGFMCLRFEIGADKNESALYVYELHIHSDFQRQGLGEELIRMARHLAVEFKMDKIMLTVFMNNDIALKFYNKLKFSPDKSTPAKNEADYLILSSKVK